MTLNNLVSREGVPAQGDMSAPATVASATTYGAIMELELPGLSEGLGIGSAYLLNCLRNIA